MFLKQSTAVVVQFGPFVDKADGFTLKTGLVSALDHATTGILLSKNGAAMAVRHATVSASVYDAHGCYRVTLDTTDVGTLGKLRMIYTDATTCLPVWRDFDVVPPMIYDSIIGGSDRLDVNVTHIADTSQTARDIGASVLLSPGTGTGQLDITAGVTKANATQIAGAAVDATAAQLGVNVVNWKGSAAPAMTGDAFARLGAPAGASAAADIAAVKALLPTALTADGNMKADALRVGGTTQTGRDIGAAVPNAAPGANGGLPTVNGSNYIAGIQGTTNTLDAVMTRLGAPAGASLSVDIAAIKTIVDAVTAKTTNLPATPASQGDVTSATSTITTNQTTINNNIVAVNSKLGTPAGASVSADIAAAKADTAAIKVKTDFLPSATAGANGGLPTVDASNRIAGIAGTITTLDALDTAQDTQHAASLAAIRLLGHLDAFWYSEAVGVAGTTPGTNGTWLNPSATEAAIDTMRATVKFNQLVVLDGTYMMPSDYGNFTFQSSGEIDMNGRDITSTAIVGGKVIGTAIGESGIFSGLTFGTAEIPPGSGGVDIVLAATLALGDDGNYSFDGLRTEVGATAVINGNGAVANLSIANFFGDLAITNLGAGSVVKVSGKGSLSLGSGQSGVSVSILDSTISVNNGGSAVVVAPTLSAVADAVAGRTIPAVTEFPGMECRADEAIAWLMARNGGHKIVQSASVQAVRNLVDDADIALAPVTDNGTESTIGPYA